MRRFLDRLARDRRVSSRLAVKTPLKVRLWKSATPEHAGQAENISEQGMFFATDLRMGVGTVVEVVLKMPQEITGSRRRSGDVRGMWCGCRRWIRRWGRRGWGCSLIVIR